MKLICSSDVSIRFSFSSDVHLMWILMIWISSSYNLQYELVKVDDFDELYEFNELDGPDELDEKD